MIKKFGKIGANVEAPKTGDKSASPRQRATTTAHLLHTAGNQLGHTKVHFDNMGKKTNSKEKQLDYEHAGIHLDGGQEHIDKLHNHIMANYPDEAKELQKLEASMPVSLHGRLATAITHHKGKK